MFKIKATKPALTIKLIILSHSSIQIEIKTIKNNITDNGIPALLIFRDNEKLQSFESKQWKELLQ